MPLLERARVEVYVPDLSAPVYRNLLLAFEEEFTYAFGGCTIVKGLAGSYLSHAGVTVSDRINLIYTDFPSLSTNFQTAASYTRQLKEAVHAVLPEETVLVAACQVYHSV